MCRWLYVWWLYMSKMWGLLNLISTFEECTLRNNFCHFEQQSILDYRHMTNNPVGESQNNFVWLKQNNVFFYLFPCFSHLSILVFFTSKRMIHLERMHFVLSSLFRSIKSFFLDDRMIFRCSDETSNFSGATRNGRCGISPNKKIAKIVPLEVSRP